MPEQPDEGFVWHLGSMITVGSSSNPWTLNIGEPISAEEYASHAASASFLDEVLSNSAFAGFQELYMEFRAANATAAESFSARRANASKFTVIRRKFDDLLSALRRLDDRTSHALSSRYGKESIERRSFKESLSFEYDSNFAYRFCYNLRNYSDHRGSPISRIRQSSHLKADGTTEQLFEPVFDSRILLSDHEWPARVREDLERIDEEFLVESTTADLYQSCARAHCKNLLSQEQGMLAAIANIGSLAARAPTEGSLAPIFIQINPQDIISRSPKPFNVSVVRTEMIDLAQTALQEAHQFLQL
jgi:hypothetical protein